MFFFGESSLPTMWHCPHDCTRALQTPSPSDEKQTCYTLSLSDPRHTSPFPSTVGGPRRRESKPGDRLAIICMSRRRFPQSSVANALHLFSCGDPWKRGVTVARPPNPPSARPCRLSFRWSVCFRHPCAVYPSCTLGIFGAVGMDHDIGKSVCRHTPRNHTTKHRKRGASDSEDCRSGALCEGLHIFWCTSRPLLSCTSCLCVGLSFCVLC